MSIYSNFQNYPLHAAMRFNKSQETSTAQKRGSSSSYNLKFSRAGSTSYSSQQSSFSMPSPSPLGNSTIDLSTGLKILLFAGGTALVAILLTHFFGHRDDKAAEITEKSFEKVRSEFVETDRFRPTQADSIPINRSTYSPSSYSPSSVRPFYHYPTRLSAHGSQIESIILHGLNTNEQATVNNPRMWKQAVNLLKRKANINDATFNAALSEVARDTNHIQSRALLEYAIIHADGTQPEFFHHLKSTNQNASVRVRSRQTTPATSLHDLIVYCQTDPAETMRLHSALLKSLSRHDFNIAKIQQDVSKLIRAGKREYEPLERALQRLNHYRNLAIPRSNGKNVANIIQFSEKRQPWWGIGDADCLLPLTEGELHPVFTALRNQASHNNPDASALIQLRDKLIPLQSRNGGLIQLIQRINSANH